MALRSSKETKPNQEEGNGNAKDIQHSDWVRHFMEQKDLAIRFTDDVKRVEE